MFCRNCGKEMDNMAVVCVSCGAPARKGNNFCPNCGEASNPMAQICIRCGVNFITVNTEQKSKLVAGLLGIFLGGLGIHRFYLGYVALGIIQLLLTVIIGPLTCGVGIAAGWLWGLIEGIVILCGTGITKDAQGVPLKD